MSKIFEVLFKDHWLITEETTFWACALPRRIDGIPYSGPIYYEGTNVPYIPETRRYLGIYNHMPCIIYASSRKAANNMFTHIFEAPINKIEVFHLKRPLPFKHLTSK